MDKRKQIEELEECQEQIHEILKRTMSKELYETWAYTFDIEEVNEDEVVISYHADMDFAVFKEQCKEPIALSISSILGEEKKLIIVQKSAYSILSPKTKKKIRALKFFAIGMVFVCIAVAIIVVMCNYIGNRNFRETFYVASDIKVDSPIRIIQLSDLHTCSYGKNNEKLISRIKELKPDIIICTGDIVDSVEDDREYAVCLMEALADIAPSYYIYGNNEREGIYDFSFNEGELDTKLGFEDGVRDEQALLKIPDTFEARLEETGVKVLKNEKDTIEVKDITVDVYGVLNSNPSSFWSYSGNLFSSYLYENESNLKITAVHEPFIFDEFQSDYFGDLMLAGHTHGGVIRVPVLGPFFTKEGGLFPARSGKYIYGRFGIRGNTLIVSGGLENRNIFRVNNQPELIVIDINKF